MNGLYEDIRKVSPRRLTVLEVVLVSETGTDEAGVQTGAAPSRTWFTGVQGPMLLSSRGVGGVWRAQGASPPTPRLLQRRGTEKIALLSLSRPFPCPGVVRR